MSSTEEQLLHVLTERNVPAEMRDGVKLYADIYRPSEGGPYPVLLLRTPYNKEDAQTMNYAHPEWYARRGYVVIVQDTRGRWSSEGDFAPYDNEEQDGYDTIEWAAALPYALPKVGMYGFSYCGAVQWLAAAASPPHLACIAPGMTGSDSYQGKTYRNGAFALAALQSWVLFAAQDTALRKNRGDWAAELSEHYASIHGYYKKLPLDNPPGPIGALAPYYADWLRHPARDEYWSSRSNSERYGSIRVPALHIGGWYDLFIDGTIENFNGMREKGATPEAKEHQYLHIEPWFHMPWSRYVGELDFGPEAANRIDRLQLEWFDWQLKGRAPKAAWPKVHYFLMGSNRWETADSWPPEEGDGRTGSLALYLHHGSKANSVNGDGRLGTEPPGDGYPDIYVYHPSIPVPAIGGRSGAVPDLTPMGPKNQLPVEIRNDVLVYTSDPLEEELRIAGEITLELYASTSAEDTDFVAKLVDVYPDGRAYNVAEGIVRASCRNGTDKREAVPPGEIIRYNISLGPTAISFLKGHSVRLDLTSSLFPTYDRNPNRLMNPGEVREADFATATQTIYHDAARPSRIWLPVLDNNV